MDRSAHPQPVFVVHPDPRWGRLLQSAWVLSAMLTLGWLLWHLARASEALPATVVLGLVAMLALQRVLRPKPLPSSLPLQAPDGHSIDWQLDARAGSLSRVIDAGDWLLLHHRASSPGSGSTWLALSRRDHPLDWHRLRCALLARPGSTPPLPAER